jgi:hypothetical protein
MKTVNKAAMINRTATAVIGGASRRPSFIMIQVEPQIVHIDAYAIAIIGLPERGTAIG